MHFCTFLRYEDRKRRFAFGRCRKGFCWDSRAGLCRSLVGNRGADGSVSEVARLIQLGQRRWLIYVSATKPII